MEFLQLKSSISELLLDAGIDSGEFEINALAGGGNNRVYSVRTKDSNYLAKLYYCNASDTRNRLTTEFSFLSYAWDTGIRCVPRPISSSLEKNMGLYEYVEGRKLESSELNQQHIAQAAHFIKELNLRQKEHQASQLTTASEGGFSLQQHFSLIDARIKNLIELPSANEIDHQAHAFVEELNSYWHHLKQSLLEEGPMEDRLTYQDRCVSPSDFGFHNALARDTGELCFIDFEYAGWDDPAKMAGDFFSQPAIPVPFEHFDLFLTEALSYSPNKALLTERAYWLLPVFQIKWCCIMLNEFLPDAAKRRQFANPMPDPQQNKRLQLEKAQKFFNTRLI